MFSPVVTDHWLSGHAVPDAAYAVVVEEAPPLGRPLQVVDLDGSGLVRVTHGRAVDISGDQLIWAELEAVGLDSPDQLFYLPAATSYAAPAGGTRRLGDADAAAFEALVGACDPADVDEAYVDLDHDLVVGTFVGDRLVSAASAYRWHDTPFGDIGILTAPDVRGRGHGVTTVRAMAREVAAGGLEPQYRCDVANTASAALAASAGFAMFARWWLPAG